MKKSVDFAADDHPPGGERPPSHWAVSAVDDCEECDGLRVELVVEEEGRPGTGVTAHLAAASARRLRSALAAALRDLGEPPD